MATDIWVLAQISGKDTGETPMSGHAKNSLSRPALLARSVAIATLGPVPALMIDSTLVCSMAASVLVLLSAMQARKAINLSDFSTLLLPLILICRPLDLYSLRRILPPGSKWTKAADRVIGALRKTWIQLRRAQNKRPQASQVVGPSPLPNGPRIPRGCE